jgi:hypothetical protein
VELGGWAFDFVACTEQRPRSQVCEMEGAQTVDQVALDLLASVGQGIDRAASLGP